jgi:hypothetical protein
MRLRRKRSVDWPPRPDSVWGREIAELMEKPLPSDYQRPVRSPLDVIRFYSPAVVVMGIIPSWMLWGVFREELHLPSLLAVPLGLLAGMAASWLLVYAEALGLIGLNDTD